MTTVSRGEIEEAIDRLVSAQEGKDKQEAEDAQSKLGDQDADGKKEGRGDPDEGKDAQDLLDDIKSFLDKDKELTIVNSEPSSGVWLPATPYWEELHRRLTTVMEQALGKLAPQVVKHQLGGFLDVNSAMTLERGNMRIWKRNLPDLRLEAGVHVIISVDATPSMHNTDVATGFTEVNDEFLPVGLPLLFGDRGDWIRANGESTPAGESVDQIPSGQTSDDGLWLGRSGAASGLAYGIGSAVEDAGGSSELMVWGLEKGKVGVKARVYVAKTADVPWNGRMYYFDVFHGTTGPWQPPKLAGEMFNRRALPGRVYVTISDGLFNENQAEYAQWVEKLNEAGVQTIMILVGGDVGNMARLLDAAAAAGPNGSVKVVNYPYSPKLAGPGDLGYQTRPGASILRDMGLGHRWIIAAPDLIQLTSRIPDIITRLQSDLVEAARLNSGL